MCEDTKLQWWRWVLPVASTPALSGVAAFAAASLKQLVESARSTGHLQMSNHIVLAGRVEVGSNPQLPCVGGLANPHIHVQLTVGTVLASPDEYWGAQVRKAARHCFDPKCCPDEAPNYNPVLGCDLFLVKLVDLDSTAAASWLIDSQRGEEGLTFEEWKEQKFDGVALTLA